MHLHITGHGQAAIPGPAGCVVVVNGVVMAQPSSAGGAGQLPAGVLGGAVAGGSLRPRA